MQLEQHGGGRYIGEARQLEDTDMIYAVNKRTKEHAIAYDNDQHEVMAAQGGIISSITGYRFIQTDADGWIPWAGGECPLPDGIEYEVICHSGEQGKLKNPKEDNWDGKCDEGIAFYRPIFSSELKPAEEVVRTVHCRCVSMPTIDPQAEQAEERGSLEDYRKESAEHGFIPIPNPKQCAEDLRDDGFHPQATCVERMMEALEWIAHNACQSSRLECQKRALLALRTDRDRWIKAAEYAIEDAIGEPADSTHLGLLFDEGLAKLPE